MAPPHLTTKIADYLPTGGIAKAVTSEFRQGLGLCRDDEELVLEEGASLESLEGSIPSDQQQLPTLDPNEKQFAFTVTVGKKTETFATDYLNNANEVEEALARITGEGGAPKGRRHSRRRKIGFYNL